MSAKPLIEVIAVTYKQPGPLAVFVQCFLNQTAANWKLSVWHDGPNPEFDSQMLAFEERAPGKIEHHATSVRHNDWGHSLRDRALKQADSDYVLLTNGDNYYVPKFIEAVSDAVAAHGTDVVMFDMVHSYGIMIDGKKHPPYHLLVTELRRHWIDVGAAIVRTAIAKEVGFRGRDNDADATYFEDLTKRPALTAAKVNSILFVHN